MIKNQKGITLVSLVIYIVIFVILIGIMTTASTSFYSKLGKIAGTPKYLNEFNKFSMFFVADIKNYNKATVTSDTITFENGPTYKYDGKNIYRNNVLICKYIIKCTFTPNEYMVNSTKKQLINVNMQVGQNDKKNINKNVDFTLKYW